MDGWEEMSHSFDLWSVIGWIFWKKENISMELKKKLASNTVWFKIKSNLIMPVWRSIDTFFDWQRGQKQPKFSSHRLQPSWFRNHSVEKWIFGAAKTWHQIRLYCQMSFETNRNFAIALHSKPSFFYFTLHTVYPNQLREKVNNIMKINVTHILHLLSCFISSKNQYSSYHDLLCLEG